MISTSWLRALTELPGSAHADVTAKIPAWRVEPGLGGDGRASAVAQYFYEENPAVKEGLTTFIRGAEKKGMYGGIGSQGPSDKHELVKWPMDEGIVSVDVNPDSVIPTWLFLGGERPTGLLVGRLDGAKFLIIEMLLKRMGTTHFAWPELVREVDAEEGCGRLSLEELLVFLGFGRETGRFTNCPVLLSVFRVDVQKEGELQKALREARTTGGDLLNPSDGGPR